MTDLELLTPAEAAAELSARPREARGFLGLDPVTQNAALLARELIRGQAAVFRAGSTLVGCQVSGFQPRQAQVDTTGTDPDGLRTMLELLASYRRCTSYLGLASAERAPVYEASGFRRTGSLRHHRWAGGRYHDTLVFYASRPR